MCGSGYRPRRVTLAHRNLAFRFVPELGSIRLHIQTDQKRNLGFISDWSEYFFVQSYFAFIFKVNGKNGQRQLLNSSMTVVLDDDSDMDVAPKLREAIDMSTNEVIRELVDRGIKPKGYPKDDAKRLQIELDQEHIEVVEEYKRKKVEGKRRMQSQNTLQQRRQRLDREKREEEEAVGKDHKIISWLDLIKKNKTPEWARLFCDNITGRALAKSLPNNRSLCVLDLSRNKLGNEVAALLAKMLKTNKTMVKLELDSNSIGPAGAQAFGEALASHNHTLSFLSLDSNPLTRGETDFTGMSSLGEMMKTNTTLTSLNLWRCAIGGPGGVSLSQGLRHNHSIIYLDVENSNVGILEERAMADKLDENRSRFEQLEHKRREASQVLKREREESRLRDEIERKRVEDERWIEEQRALRAENRKREAEEERRRATEAEEQRVLELKRREEADKKRREEEEAKKKKKKRKKGGKKKK